MARLKRTTYRYELESGEVFEVTPILADLLRAELEGPRHGIKDPSSHAIHTTVLWLWSAGLRAGQHELDFQTFKAAVVNFEPVKEGELEVQGVPPTSAASPLPLPSPSPTDTGTPPPQWLGSTPSPPETPTP